MNVLLSDSDFEVYPETSDSEDQDDGESTYSGEAQGILSSMDASIEKIDGFLAYERGFTHGDIVCSIMSPSGQSGRVVDIDMTVDLETTYGELIKGVNSKKLLKVRSFGNGDYVIHGPWVGMVDRVFDAVTVIFDDGSTCEIVTGDGEILTPVSPTLFEDGPYPYYPGQHVRIKHPNVSESSRWLCGSSKGTHDEGTIYHVEVGLVLVDWIASIIIGPGGNPTTPHRLQDPKKLTLLSCFPHANWQLGDWCTLPSDYFTKESTASSTTPRSFTKMQKKFGLNGQYYKEIYTIARIKTKVDILWQNGNWSLGLDSQTLFPVNNIGDHDFWPNHFVAEKAISDDVHAPNGPRSGIVKSFDAQERTVKVKWLILDSNLKFGEGYSEEEIVSAYELIEHPNFSYCIGDVVFRFLPHFGNLRENILDVQATGHADEVTGYLSCIGNAIGFKDGAIEVRWANGLVSMVEPSEIFGLDKFDEPASVPEFIEEAIPENFSKETVDQEKLPFLKKEKVVNEFNQECVKDTRNASALLFLWATIGYLADFATSLFSSHGSHTNFLGFSQCEGGSEPPSLKLGESHWDVDDPQPDSKPQAEEIILNEQPDFSLANENPEKFKQFDTVIDYSDHHFPNNICKGTVSPQVKKGWLKKVHQEWNILKKDLPESIYVRVYEERIDILRACIIGSAGTPYHDGLFFFDIFFPPDYPQDPPMVHYISGGLRLNPNLYESGKVCLSLLNTWTGNGTEVWNPESSTVLQVLLSLQALVLNDKPYFNEAGFDQQIGRAEGEKNSITYNENAYLLSCKSIMHLLRKPPKHFEALLEEHLSRRSHHILLACKAYMAGAQVGRALAPGEVEGECCSTGFKIMLSKLYPMIVASFAERGIDCDQIPDAGEISK